MPLGYAPLAGDTVDVQVEVAAAGHRIGQLERHVADDVVEVLVEDREHVLAVWDVPDGEGSVRLGELGVDLVLAAADVAQGDDRLLDGLAEVDLAVRGPSDPGLRLAGDAAALRRRAGQLVLPLHEAEPPRRPDARLDSSLDRRAKSRVVLGNPRKVDQVGALERGRLEPLGAVGGEHLDLVPAGREVRDRDVAVRVGQADTTAQRVAEVVGLHLAHSVVETNLEPLEATAQPPLLSAA